MYTEDTKKQNERPCPSTCPTCKGSDFFTEQDGIDKNISPMGDTVTYTYYSWICSECGYKTHAYTIYYRKCQ